MSDVRSGIHELLEGHGLNPNDIDVLLCGMNGDSRQQGVYDMALQEVPMAAVAGFKHLTGEYATASGFAVWLASEMIRSQRVPEVVAYREANTASVKNILILNHYITGSVSLILIGGVAP